MGQPSSQVPRSSHITAEEDFISDGAYPTSGDHINYPELFEALQEGSHPSGEQHAAALLTVRGETHLIQGGPNFLEPPTLSHRPTWPPLHAQSLTPAVIGIVHSAFPDTGYKEYKGLANDLIELVNSHKKESHQRISQQQCWIEGLQNHVRELYAHIEDSKHALQTVLARFNIHGLTIPGPVDASRSLIEPFSLYQPTAATTPPPFPRGSTPTKPPPFPQGPAS